MRRYPFVCIEGVDGVGKSTVAKRLAVTLNGIYYKTPPAPYDTIRAIIDAKADPFTRFHFYMSAVAFASAEVARLRETAPVVCDRYVYSTLAYHVTMDKRLKRSLSRASILMPDYTALLVVDEAERLRRLRIRSGNGALHDARIEADSSFLAQVEQEFLALDLAVIDTTTLSVDDVIKRILAMISVDLMAGQEVI